MATVGVEENPDVDAVRARIRARGVRIRTQEADRAIERLEERTELSEREKRAIRELARSLTDQLLSVPERHLEAVAGGEFDSEQARETLALFGGDEAAGFSIE